MHATGGVEAIDFSEYLQELCADISRSLMPEGHQCRVDSEPVLTGSKQASSLALIVNELVTNAIKHGDKNSAVEVKLGHFGEVCRLVVRNAGVLPADYDSVQRSGFGTQMVNMLVDQLDGRLEASSIAGETEFAVSFVPDVPQSPHLMLVENKTSSTEF